MKTVETDIHLLEGAITKDGPAAGVNLVSSLVSAMTESPVRNDLAMTGEITIRGLVLQIGGLKEKLLAAKRGKISEVIIPKENEKDLPDVPDEILKGLKISPVERLEEVIAIALTSAVNPLTDEEIAEEEKRFEETKSRVVPPGTAAEDSAISPV